MERARGQRELSRSSPHSLGQRAEGIFFGDIVAIPKSVGVLEIVDGQQRLATTAILLAAIRDALSGRKADELIVERIENLFSVQH